MQILPDLKKGVLIKYPENDVIIFKYYEKKCHD